MGIGKDAITISVAGSAGLAEARQDVIVYERLADYFSWQTMERFMEWLAENWGWVLIGVVLVGMHLLGHGGHGRHGKRNKSNKHKAGKR